MGTYPPHFAYPSAPAVVRAVPDPPRLNWALLLLLSLITLGIFGQVWLIVQSLWVRKVFSRSKALPWTIAYAAVLPGFFAFAIVLGIVASLTHSIDVKGVLSILTPLVRIGIFVLWMVTVLTLRGELQSDPINIPLSGFMALFFGPVYFQYHLFEYRVSDEVHQFRGPLRPELPHVPPSGSPGA